MTTPSRMARAWSVLRTGVDPVAVTVINDALTPQPTLAPCFHWQDVNDDEPPIGVPVVGMWIDSDGTTSTLDVTYGFDHDGSGPGPEWSHDGMVCRPPHAWCSNPDAHQAH